MKTTVSISLYHKILFLGLLLQISASVAQITVGD